MMFNIENQDELIHTLSNKIMEQFPTEVEYAVIFGSRARLENKPASDIDLLLIFKDGSLIQSKVDEFKEFFIQFHVDYALIPDEHYPGEFITRSELEKAIAGYGFTYDQKHVEILPLAANEWTTFNEYRQWLSACAGPSQLIIGDPASFEELKTRCLQSIILLLLLSGSKDTFDQQEIITRLLDEGKEYLGFCNTNYTRQYLDRHLPLILSKLEQQGLVLISENKYTVRRSNAINSLNRLTDKSEFDLKSKFLGDIGKEYGEKVFRKCLDIGVDFITNNHHKVLNFYPEQKVQANLLENIPEKGQALEQVISEYQTKILDGSIRQSSPNYLAFPDSGNATSALAASILECFTNQNLIATAKSAPTGTFVEVQVIHWLRQLIGFANPKEIPGNALDVGGVMVTGGTLANTIGLLVARCKVFPESRKQGLTESNIKPILLIAGDTIYHYSHIAAFWWLGLGEENIVKINMLNDYRLDYDDLETKLVTYNNSKTSKVVAVVAQAGDSRTTTIENFEKIALITRKHSVWLHVDACHGGVALFSKNLKAKMQGIEMADSISIDPHKGLGIPYSSSAILFRDLADLQLISKSTDITIQKSSFDLGQITPFLGSRPFDSLKLWFFMKHLGVDGVGELVDYRFSLAKKWSITMNESKYFIALNNVELNSVVFSISPEKLQSHYPDITFDSSLINQINQSLHNLTYTEGYMCIHTFDIIDVTEKIIPSKQKLRVLGVTIGNPHTSDSDFSGHLEYLEKLLEKIINSL